MRIILLAGARPTLIKIAPLLPALADAGISADVALAGERDHGVPSNRTDQVSLWGVSVPAPRWFLDVDAASAVAETGRALAALDPLLAESRPDAVLAVGDHDPTLALAIAAAKHRIPVAHLEAGLRCGDMMVPQEVNRVLISRVASLHLACDEASMGNLTAEGVDPDRVVLVGSILAESVIRHGEEVRGLDTASGFGLARGEYVLASFHCADNLTDAERCRGIIDGLDRLGMPVLMPDAHGTTGMLDALGIRAGESVRIVEAAPYQEMLALIRDAAVVVTDSGGVQEEACMLATPCVTVRRCTERVVTVEVGANRLADATPEAIGSSVRDALESPRKWLTPKRWDKAVSQRVVRALRRGVPGLE